MNWALALIRDLFFPGKKPKEIIEQGGDDSIKDDLDSGGKKDEGDVKVILSVFPRNWDTCSLEFSIKELEGSHRGKVVLDQRSLSYETQSEKHPTFTICLTTLTRDGLMVTPRSGRCRMTSLTSDDDATEENDPAPIFPTPTD